MRCCLKHETCFLHRLSGVLELRERVHPDGRRLFCTGKPGCANCRRRVRPFRAGSFPLNLSGGFAVCGRRDVAAPAAGAKSKDNLRFSFLFELLPFPCFLIWRRLPICDRCEKEYGRGFFLCCGRTTFGVRPLEQPVRSVRYCSATHVVSSTQARHDSAAQLFNTLYRTAPTN